MEVYKMIKTALGDDSLSHSKTFDYLKCFKDGQLSQQSTKDDPHEKVWNNCTLSVPELVYAVGISVGSFLWIFTDILQIRRVATKFVPRLLTLEHKEEILFNDLLIP